MDNTLRKMEDLNGLAKKALRLHPSAFGLTHNATDDFVFQSYQIRKGEDILIFTTADHTNPNCFPEPEKFDIDRHYLPRNEHRSPVATVHTVVRVPVCPTFCYR